MMATERTASEAEISDTPKVTSPDDIIREIGGCGRFQVILSLTVHLMKTVIAWSLGGSVFILYPPKWRCEDLDFVNITTTGYNTSINEPGNTSGIEYWNKQCLPLPDQPCKSFAFDTRPRTLVSEFGLVCDLSWVPSTIMSMQMAGLCAGNLLAGQIADIFGRKKPMFLSMVMLFTFNLTSYFSVNWMMFAVCRIFIGLGCGFFLSIQYNLMSEYTLSTWRSVIIGFPSFTIQICIYTAVAWLTQDWKVLILMISVTSFALFGAWFVVPESFRWHVGHDRHADAEVLIRKIAKFNKCAPVKDTILLNSFAKGNTTADNKKYTLVDLFRNRELLKKTLCLMICWFTVGFGSYGIGFGVQRLSGNIFLNLFLFNITGIPSKFIMIFFQNKFGRKVAMLIALTVCGLGGIGAGVVQYIDMDDDSRGKFTNYLALVADTAVGGLWGPLQTVTVEVFPTVIRSLSFGYLSTMARIGAIIGPQMVYLTDFVPGLLYFAVALVCFLSICSTLLLPETRHAYLQDKISDQQTEKRKEKAELV